MGTATITDGSEKTFPDGSKRLPIPKGTTFKFPLSKVVKEDKGNPTITAWAFLMVSPRYDSDGSIIGNQPNYISVIFCVVPLPGSA
jgi:hypothetical protein